MIKQLLCMPLLLIAAGCWAGGKDLPRVRSEQLALDGPRSSVGFDVQYCQGKSAEPAKFPSGQERVQEVLQKSNMFSNVSVGCGKADYDLKLKFVAAAERDSASDLTAGEWVNAIASGVTIFMVPLFWEQQNALYVDVEKGGVRLKQYRYQDRFGAFAWTLVGVIGVIPTAVVATNEQHDNMIRNALLDIRTDQVLKTGRGSVQTGTVNNKKNVGARPVGAGGG